ncbi:hypothetical protein L208DRAFT_1382550 [Tricholoma matsutake]|nr:hypothetical protein L208DRAFT_1382547 [Tricholoma matsutake 945]KAF8220730.1 hypothetical protein L208DRAFT_1382550 [Tricholoma matsutake 945]
MSWFNPQQQSFLLSCSKLLLLPNYLHHLIIMQPKCSVCFDNLCIPKMPAVVTNCGQHSLSQYFPLYLHYFLKVTSSAGTACNNAKALRGHNVHDLAISLAKVDTSNPEVVSAIKNNYKKELWFRIKDIQDKMNKKMEHTKCMEGLIMKLNESFLRHTKVQQEMILHRTDLTECLLQYFKKKLQELQQRSSYRSSAPLPSNTEGQTITRDSNQSSIAKWSLESDSGESSKEEMVQEERHKCLREG